MRYLFSFLLGFVLLSCHAPRTVLQEERNPEEQPYVIILSMDAFRHDLAGRAHTPTLDSLKRVGCYSEIYPVFPSNTFPSHYSMATGLHPDHHGVVNNNFYDKKAQVRRSVFKRSDVLTKGFWGGEPIWNTAERQGRVANIFMWPGSDVPINGRQATKWMNYSSKPSYYERANWVIDAMTRAEEDIPNLVMWYFEEPDASMHRYGPTSKQVIAKAEHIDSVLTYFFYRIRRSPVFDRIHFIVTADHGMTDLSELKRVNLYHLLDTTQVVRVIHGSPYGLEVKPEYRDRAIEILKATEGITAWKREEVPAKYHYGTREDRLTNIIILPKMGWTIDYENHPRALRKKGAHGFDNFERDMHMVFYGSGPRFKQNHVQPSFQNHNMYLILCYLLGVKPSESDCQWEQIEDMFCN